jgi:hypothetical protein
MMLSSSAEGNHTQLMGLHLQFTCARSHSFYLHEVTSVLFLGVKQDFKADATLRGEREVFNAKP